MAQREGEYGGANMQYNSDEEEIKLDGWEINGPQNPATSSTDAIQKLRVACLSTMNGGLSETQNVVGLIVYDIGTYPAKQRVGRNIYPGYIVMKPIEDIQHHPNEEGQVHGKLCRDFFDQTPTEMARDFGAVLGGFAIMNGQFKENSATFNCRPDYRKGVHDGKRAMSATEIDLIKGVVAIWTEGGCNQVDMTVK